MKFFQGKLYFFGTKYDVLEYAIKFTFGLDSMMIFFIILSYTISLQKVIKNLKNQNLFGKCDWMLIKSVSEILGVQFTFLITSVRISVCSFLMEGKMENHGKTLLFRSQILCRFNSLVFQPNMYALLHDQFDPCFSLRNVMYRI